VSSSVGSRSRSAVPGRTRLFAGHLALLMVVGAGGAVAATVAAGPGAAAAQTVCPPAIALGNGDFEAPTVAAGAGRNVSDTNPAAVWKTTASDTQIEYWANGGNVQGANGGLAISAQAGSQWVELNATQASTLYQDLATNPGQVLHWSLWHRARYVGVANGQDVMRVLIGTPAAQTQQGANISDGPNGWGNTTGSYVVPAGQTTTRFAFQAVSSVNGNPTFGNFLDNIEFSNSPCLSVAKSVTNLSPGSGGLTRPGDTLQYTVTATNVGGDDANNSVLTDAIPANTTYVPGSLVVSGVPVTDATDSDTGEVGGGTVTGRVGSAATSTTGGNIARNVSTAMTFKVTVDAGVSAGTSIANTGAATYQWNPSPTVLTATSNTTTSTVDIPGIDLVKSITGTTDVNGDGRLATGDQIAYAFDVTNTGSTSLTSVAVNDSKATVTCPPGVLAAGATKTCTATYPITQADVDNSPLVNTGTATGTPPAGAAPITSAPSSASQALDQTASLALVKSGGTVDTNGNGRLDVGDEIAYSFAVTNTGSVTLNPIAVNDPQAGLSAITCPTPSLAGGAATTCTARYPITQSDLDAGVVTNTATASGQAPNGSTSTSGPSTADVSLPAAPGLTMTKSAAVMDVDGDFLIDLGDRISWTFLLTNTGNVTLTSIGVSDATAGPVTCPTATLAPGDQVTCAATTDHTINQGDVDAGVVSNTATASGNDPTGNPTTSSPSSTDTPVAQGSALIGTKHAAVNDLNNDGRTDLGDTITYSVTVHNSGHVTLHAVSIDDPTAGTFTCPSAPLPPGDDLTCTASVDYTITQADVDAGHIDNTATAHALDPTNATVDGQPSDVTTPVDASSDLLLVKQATLADTSGDGHRGVGDTLSWTFALTNTGTRSLSGLSVDDPTAGPVTCAATSLAPGAATTCAANATHTVTQADVDAGVVSNTATAEGMDLLSRPVASNPSSTDTALDQLATLQLMKQGEPTDANGSGVLDAGDTIQWTFTVTNTGLVTLTSVSVDDPTAGPVTCPATTLAPGESTICTADQPYVITAADAAAGAVRNRATATADCGCGAMVLAAHAAAVVAAIHAQVDSGSGLPFTGANGLPELLASGVLAVLFGFLLASLGRRRRSG
jgi:uncharacterized repeat protein (TIGR01451 family)